MIKLLEKSLSNELVHFYTEDDSVKYILIKMRASLKQPNLQILMNEIWE